MRSSQTPQSRSWKISLHLAFQPILVSWCLPLSHIFTQKFLKFSHSPPPQAWYTVKPVFHGPHIRGRGWLKARKRALLVLLDDFKHKLKLRKVKHTSQDLCLDFHDFCHATSVNFLCHKRGQALTNKLKKQWRSNRSSWSLIMLLCVQFKNTRVLSVHSVAILVSF